MARSDLIYYDALNEELRGTQVDKAKKLFQLGLIDQLSSNEFRVNPIEGYNKTAYIIKGTTGLLGFTGLSCNCQFNKMTGKTCSHMIAVRIQQKPRLMEVL